MLVGKLKPHCQFGNCSLDHDERRDDMPAWYTVDVAQHCGGKHIIDKS